MNIFIVIPAYNEASVIQEVIREIQKAGYENIIVVDDGSQDDAFQKAQEIPGIRVFRHKINRGQGAAIKTGIEAAKLLGADVVVTMDGDGQHDPEDIQKLIDPILNDRYDVVLGTRLKKPEGMPLHKRFYNFIANLLTWYLFGLWVTDSQSGFRAYSKKAAELIDIRCDGYENASEIIREIYTKKLKYKEVPIRVIYTDYSQSKIKRQNLANGLATLYKMFWKLIN